VEFEWTAYTGMFLAHIPKRRPNTMYMSYNALCGVDLGFSTEPVGDRPECGICQEELKKLEDEGEG
jgi:hypothetical protein